METPKTEILVTVAGRTHANFLFDPGEYVFGSGDGCHVRCGADDVAEQHAKLTINFDSVLIEDLGSSSGTHVNGKRVTETTRLWPNQKIQLGTATITLRRLKTGSSPYNSIAPQTAAVRRVLPEEFLRDKKYEIGGVVAQGGMGAILDAREATTSRTVAMKVMLDTNSPEVLMRFVTEAKITAQLEHPGIVPVYELSVDENDQVFYTMKFVRGVTLKNIVESLAAGDAAAVAKYPLVVLVTIFQKVCDAIAFAHSRGIIHRDLKPENVMIGDYGEVLVMDWGLAKVLDPQRAAVMLLPPQPAPPRPEAMSADKDKTVLIPAADGDRVRDAVRATGAGMTMEGAILGTPQFMAPEQAAGLNDQLDQRADIYSLGAILCQLLTLRLPVEGKNIEEVLNKVSRGDIAWPAPFTSGAKRLPHLPFGKVPDSLDAIVRKAMSLNSDDRYPSVVALQADLVAYQNGFATSVEHAGMWKQLKLLVKRHRGTSIAAAAGLIILAIASAGFTARVIRERDRAAAGELAATQQRDAANRERLRAEINAEAAQLVNLAQTDPEDALIRSVVNVGKSGRILGEVTAPVEYGLTAALDRHRVLGTVPSSRDAVSTGKVCAWAQSARRLASFNRRVWLADLDRNLISADTYRFQDAPIEHLAVTGDAKLVALAGSDPTLRLWDSTDATKTRTWIAHSEYIRAVAFSDDNSLLFSVGSEGSLKTWTTEGTEAAPEMKLEMERQKIGLAAIGDSGLLVVAVGDSPLTTEAQIFIRESHTQPFRRITVAGHTSRITATAVSADGERIATADGDGTIRVWNRDGALIGGPSQIHRGPVMALAFDPGSDFIASRESAGIAALTTAEGIIMHGPFPCGDGRNLAATGDGRLIVDSHVLDLLGLESAPPLVTGTNVLDLAQSQDGSLLAAIDDRATVRVWKLPSRELLSETVIAPGRGRFLSISPDNSVIAASLLAEDAVHFIHPDGTTARAPLHLKGEVPNALRFHAPTGRLIIATEAGSLVLFHPKNDATPVWSESLRFASAERESGAGLYAERDEILLRFSSRRGAGIFSLTAEARILASVSAASGAPGMVMGFPGSMAVTLDGKRALLLGQGGIHLWSFPDLQAISRIPVKSGWPSGVISIGVSGAGDIMVGSGDGGVRLLNNLGEPLGPWLIRDRKPFTVLLRDNKNDDILVAGRSGRIHFWESNHASWMALAAGRLSQSPRIQRPETALDHEAAQIVAANLPPFSRYTVQTPRGTARRAASAPQAAPGKDAPGTARVPGVPFALKIPEGWVVADSLKIAFLDKLVRTMIFKDQGREVSLVAGFLPKDASILQITSGGNTPLVAITRLNGGTSPAELGVFARRAKQLAQKAMQVLGTLRIDAQASRDGFLTRWNDAANTAVIDFDGKVHSGERLLLRGYYVPTREATYVLGCKFTGESAASSMEEMDKAIAAIRLPEASRMDAAFALGFRKEIAGIEAEEIIDRARRERDRLRAEARRAKGDNRLPEAITLIENATQIATDLAAKTKGSDAATWILEASKSIEEQAGFYADNGRHAEALRTAEDALQKAGEAMERLQNRDARNHLIKCNTRVAVARIALKKLPEAAAAYEAAILLQRDEAKPTPGNNPGALRGAVDSAFKLADIRADLKDTDGVTRALDGAAADHRSLATLRVKDACETLPGLLDKVKQRRDIAAANTALASSFPAITAALEPRNLDPDILLAGLRAFVRTSEIIETTPGMDSVTPADLLRESEKLAARLKAADAFPEQNEILLSGARMFARPLRPLRIPRDARATPAQLDLSSHYNGELDVATFAAFKGFHLRALPDGLQTFDGVLFDVRGIVQASGTGFPKDTQVPARIAGIAAHQNARRIHVLHGARYKEAQPDITIGSYILHYADGTSAALPIIYGKDLRDWNATSEPGQPTPDAPIAWTGYGGSNGVRLYHRAYENPHPEREIATIDLVSSGKTSAPFVIAITME